MANQGCPGEGTDTRPWIGAPAWMGKVICALQRAGSFHDSTEPLSILVAFPPFIVINSPWFGGKRIFLRAGFRYDKNWQGYIFPEAALKITDHTVFY